MHLLTSVLLDHISRTRDFPMVLLHPMVHHRNDKTPKCNPAQGFLRSVSHILRRCFFNFRFHISLHIAARQFFKSSILNQPLSTFFSPTLSFLVPRHFCGKFMYQLSVLLVYQEELCPIMSVTWHVLMLPVSLHKEGIKWLTVWVLLQVGLVAYMIWNVD